MSQYDVSGSRTIYQHAVIEAETPNEAIAKFRELYADMTPETVDLLGDKDMVDGSWAWVGRCEGCQREIVDTDDNVVDDDGIYLCAQCHEPSVAVTP